MPLDCALETIQDKGQPNNPESLLRNLCFANNIYFTDLLPRMDYGGRLCILTGLTEEDRVNLHDWNIRNTYLKEIPSGGKELVHILKLVQRGLKLPVLRRKSYQGICEVKGAFLYHGKGDGVIEMLQGNWVHILARANVTAEVLKRFKVASLSQPDCGLMRNHSFSFSGGDMLWSGRRFAHNISGNSTFCGEEVARMLTDDGHDINWIRDRDWKIRAEGALKRLQALRAPTHQGAHTDPPQG